MSITVYWTCREKEWMLAEEPESVSKRFYKNKNNSSNNNPGNTINRCPVFNNNLKNLFCLKSLYDYEFSLEKDFVHSDFYDQKFFDDHVLIRSIEEKFFSFRNRYIFFTEEKSLPTTFYEFPFLEDNNITERCMPVSGIFDIGKWFRPTEFAFYLRKNQNSFKIEKEEVYSYIRFHTKEKIQFKQFLYTEKIQKYEDGCLSLNSSCTNLGKIEEYYKNFRSKSLILKEIKNNLI
jgi:hypothetical protein